MAVVESHKETSTATFPPSEAYKRQSRLASASEFWEMHRQSLEEPERFWGHFAQELYWKKPPRGKFLEYNFDVQRGPIYIRWCKGAETNICYNALDRNLEKGYGSRIAYYWEGNDPQDQKSITYQQLFREVCRCANVLKKKGVKKGDCVGIYMPMILELVVSMLACARIGAVHSVVFGGYSAEALAVRILDAKINVLITADGVWRGTKLLHLKQIVDNALSICRDKGHQVETALVVKHVTDQPFHDSVINGEGINDVTHRRYQKPGERPVLDLEVPWDPKVDTWWQEEMDLVTDVCSPAWTDAEDHLFYLYTSGSTGKPKGIVHTVGGFMVYGLVTFRYVFDYHPGEVHFCTADIGWLTGHTYIVYGPLLEGATSVMFEGVPCHPDPGRYWAVVEKYRAAQFYTAPTAIRTLMKYDNSFVTRYDRSSLKLVASVGEPLNPEAWLWYHQVVGEGRCPIVDTFWQTETGGHLMTSFPGCTVGKPGSTGFPVFGVDAAILDNDGNEIKGTGTGFLVFKRPWPAIFRTLYNDPKRFQELYFSRFPGYYFTGDQAKRDHEGYYFVTGRVDDMLNVSGHLLSTSEVESALLEHPDVAESAVVAHPHPVKGECLYCFVALKEGIDFTEEIAQKLRNKVDVTIGRFAVPEYVHPAPDGLPKTRSGKVLRRLLRLVAKGQRDLGDTSTVANPGAIECLFQTPVIRTPTKENNVYRFVS